MSRRSLVFLLFVIVLGLVVNWSYPYETVASKNVTMLSVIYREERFDTVKDLSAAGWPIKFLTRIAHHDVPNNVFPPGADPNIAVPLSAFPNINVPNSNIPDYVVFRWDRVLLNLCLWSAFIVLVLFYERRLDQIFAKKTEKGKRRLSIFDILIAMPQMESQTKRWLLDR